jgi:hypothetical protein
MEVADAVERDEPALGGISTRAFPAARRESVRTYESQGCGRSEVARTCFGIEGSRMQFLTCETFAGRAGETFDLAMGESSLPLTLAEVTPLPAQAFPGMMRAPFSLIFRSTTPIVLPQRLYRMKNAAMGALDIFLVPIGRDVNGAVYQAVFN